jgi:hypothetical protein
MLNFHQYSSRRMHRRVMVLLPLHSIKIYSLPDTLRVMTISSGFVQHNFCSFIIGLFGMTSPFAFYYISLSAQNETELID